MIIIPRYGPDHIDPVEIRTPDPRTGKAHPKCYAAPLADCSEKLSREHFISEGVLELLGQSLTLTGFPWLSKGESRAVSIKSLAPSVLCERHNTALSPLDAEAKRFFSSLAKARTVASHGLHLSLGFSGIDLERWLLKALLGAAASGNLHHSGSAQRLEADVSVLQVLFEGALLPSYAGLYVLTHDGPFTMPTEFEVGALEVEGKGVAGLYTSFFEVRMCLLLTKPNPETTNFIAKSIQRPERIVVETGGLETALDFFWPDGMGTPGTTVHIHGHK